MNLKLHFWGSQVFNKYFWVFKQMIAVQLDQICLKIPKINQIQYENNNIKPRFLLRW